MVLLFSQMVVVPLMVVGLVDRVFTVTVCDTVLAQWLVLVGVNV